MEMLILILLHIMTILFSIGSISKRFTDYLLPHTLFNVNCSGDETNLFDCPHSSTPDGSYCHYYKDAGVICQSISHQ